MVTTIRLIRYPDVDAAPADYLDLFITGGTPGATVRLLVGAIERGSDILDGNGDLTREGDPGSGGTGIPVTPGGMRNNLSEFQSAGASFTEHPGQGVALLAGEFGGGGNWYIEEVAGTP